MAYWVKVLTLSVFGSLAISYVFAPPCAPPWWVFVVWGGVAAILMGPPR